MNKIIYLDAAATYQKSDAVVNAQVDFLLNKYANAGRGICARAIATDDMIARTRARVAAFINARADQIVFTAGTTAAMNMVANMIPVSATTKLLVSDLDHHSARLPFEMQVKKKAGRVFVCNLTDDFNIDVDSIPVADVFVITAMSNVLGVPQDVERIIEAARQKNPNVLTIVDAAQFVVHEKIDVTKWNCDFMAFSVHKIGGDTGLGVLYVKNPERFAPVNFGGGMVLKIQDNDDLILNNSPEKFEAGTLPLTQISGLIPAIDNLEKNRPDLNLIKYLYDELIKIKKVRVLSNRNAALLTFVVDGMHVLDFGTLIGARGVCLRVGNMCATWIHRRLGVDGTIRVSIGAYNTIDDIKSFISYLKDVVK
ncbi:MAG: aminotransferase class V-fold PLP-dependent enzyme [Alphaproteobacteria bacterium]|nr:aminotransferase class V-fold PLP-dependent enzyme [Alphaproteobacteria bacterium]